MVLNEVYLLYIENNVKIFNNRDKLIKYCKNSNENLLIEVYINDIKEYGSLKLKTAFMFNYEKQIFENYLDTNEIDNIFYKDKDYYKRDIDPIQQYIEQGAIYLHKMTGDSLAVCKEFIQQSIKNKTLPNIKNPTVVYYERLENGDKELHNCNLYGYIKSLINNNYVLAPSFTCYLHPDVKKSVIVEYMDNNVALRNKAKKIAFQAEAENDIPKYIYYNNEQTNRKLDNNAISGIFAASGTVLHNPTGHSTLTSTTRSISSLANASNERIIGGNRHYHRPEIAINNIISIIKNTDFELLEKVINKFNLVIPSKEDTLNCILDSSKYYWNSKDYINEILNLIDKLSDLERAAFVYIGDLYHIRKLNDNFIRIFLTQLSNRVRLEIKDPINYIFSTPDNIVNLAHQICFNDVMGKGKNRDGYENMVLDDSIYYLIGTIYNIKTTILKYKEFIECFFVTNNLPISIAYIPNMIRQGVVLSDTDSTCVSKDEWIKWYNGKIEFTDRTRAVAGAIMYIATEALIHILAIFSSNINVDKSKLHTLAMKSEFYWDVMVPTNVAKHYYALARIKEGNVYSKPKLEKKGVHLKNSNISRKIINKGDEMIMDVLNKISNNENIRLMDYLNQIRDIEMMIRDSFLNNGIEFYRHITIKDSQAYVEDENESFYRHHLFWEDVFKPKYGSIGEPPYRVLKISTTVNNITNMKKWVENIKDIDFKNRLGRWLVKNNRNNLPTVYLPFNYLQSYGMIEEVKDIINIRKMILDNCNMYYIFLESIGFYKKPDMLISDYYNQ